jgi:glycosyltransferase involved in cell wall biosynthesis
VEKKEITVHIFQNRIPAYRVPFFLQLFDSLKRENIQVKLWISSSPYQSRGDEAKSEVSHELITTYNWLLGGYSFDIPLLPRIAFQADIVISEFGLRNIVQILNLKFRAKGALVFWGHGNELSRYMSKFEKLIRTKIIKLGEYYFVYTKSGEEYLLNNLILNSNQVFVLNNSTDTKSLRELMSIPNSSLVNKFREDVEIPDELFIACVSSVVRSKGIDKLFEIADELSLRGLNLRIMVYGSGEQLNELQSVNHPLVHFSGRIGLEGLVKLRKNALCILMPGPVGLVVTDSFAIGVPIIASKFENHGPEFSYLVHEFNCLITDGKIGSFADSIETLLKNHKYREKLVTGAISSGFKYSIESMVSNYVQAILQILKDKE